jgi:hypothetical protein
MYTMSARTIAGLVGVTVIACSSARDGDTRSGRIASTLGDPQGVDYAWSRPSSPQALRAAGYSFVARYLSWDTTGKNLSAAEAQNLFAAGIDVVANWEWDANDALDGYSTGVNDATEAQTLAAQCGMPPDRPIYFSVDFDATPGQQAAIDSYFDGVASVIGAARTGAYGGYYVIQRLFDHGKIKWGWQTYAWSGGQWDPRAQLQQIDNGVTVAGASCDIDQAVATDFGQWGPNAPTTGPGAAQAPEGSQAFLVPNQQHYMTNDGSGGLRHLWWDASTRAVAGDTWGTGIAGRPVSLVTGTTQHAFARGAAGALEHWYWDPSSGFQHAAWDSASNLGGDPAAIVIGDFQDVWAVDGGGNLKHWYWGPSTNGVKHDTWGSGVVGRPSVFLYDGDQHAFVRGTAGTLEHWWWSQASGFSHDTWGSGIASDPAALAIGEFQDVWAVDGGGNVQHWYWGPKTNGVQHDTWGSGAVGRPSVMQAGPQQHVFARGTAGTLEHWWWDPSAGISHDTWGSGIAGDPTAMLINSQQHVWAQDAAGHAQHWYWDPATNVVAHDDWGQ